jgi:hypothetical protein
LGGMMVSELRNGGNEMSELWVWRIEVLAAFTGIMALLFLVGAWLQLRAIKRAKEEHDERIGE